MKGFPVQWNKITEFYFKDNCTELTAYKLSTIHILSDSDLQYLPPTSLPISLIIELQYSCYYPYRMPYIQVLQNNKYIRDKLVLHDSGNCLFF